MATQFSELGIKPQPKGLIGDKIKIERIFGREIIVERFLIKPSKYTGECLHMQFSLNGNKHVVFTDSKLTSMIQQVPADKFPFTTKIVKQEDGSFQFT